MVRIDQTQVRAQRGGEPAAAPQPEYPMPPEPDVPAPPEPEEPPLPHPSDPEHPFPDYVDVPPVQPMDSGFGVLEAGLLGAGLLEAA